MARHGKLALSFDGLAIEPYRGSSLELRLDLNYRNLQKLPEDVLKLKDLQWLNLNVNRLRELPFELQYLKSLKWLYLESNSFDSFPLVLCQLRELFRLYLASNNLNRIPSQINQMINLRFLDLSDNSFTEFPLEICTSSLVHLEKIFFDGNDLSSLPSQISYLRGLKTLWIGNNNLEWLPQSLCDLEHLEDLKLTDNPLRTLPAYLGTNATKLKKLHWDGCPLIFPIFESLEKEGTEGLRKFQREINSRAERKKFVEFRKDSKDSEEKPCYAMRTRPRGIAVIIDNLCDLEALSNGENDHESPVKSARAASSTVESVTESTNALRSVLTKLGLNVRVMRGLMSLDIISALRFVSLEDHSYFDCLIICILSKGSNGRVKGPDGISVNVDQLTDIFSRSNCPTLADKPKLFFLQILEHENGKARKDDRSLRKEKSTESSPSGVERKKINPLNDNRLIPNDSDFLLTFAFVPQNAICSGEESVYKFYVEKLFILLEKYARKLNLLDILTTVHAEVRKKRIRTKNGYDVTSIDPIIQSSLKYNLYLSIHTSGTESRTKNK
ncbi:uncharacterized protein [Apostichopus japonicus]